VAEIGDAANRRGVALVPKLPLAFSRTVPAKFNGEKETMVSARTFADPRHEM
jgi:hypothetical protein